MHNYNTSTPKALQEAEMESVAQRNKGESLHQNKVEGESLHQNKSEGKSLHQYKVEGQSLLSGLTLNPAAITV